MTTPAAGTAPAPAARPWLARLPPGLFAIALGLLGLAGAWQRLDPSGRWLRAGRRAGAARHRPRGARDSHRAVDREARPASAGRARRVDAPGPGAVAGAVPGHRRSRDHPVGAPLPRVGRNCARAGARAAPAPGGDRVGGRRAPVDGADARRTALAGALPPDRARWFRRRDDAPHARPAGLGDAAPRHGVRRLGAAGSQDPAPALRRPAAARAAPHAGHRDRTGGGRNAGGRHALAATLRRTADGRAGHRQRPGVRGADALAVVDCGSVHGRFLVVLVPAGHARRVGGRGGAPCRLAARGGARRRPASPRR